MWVRSGIALVLVVLAAYGLFEVAPLIAGPRIDLETPEYAVAEGGFLTVSGSATHAQALSLNGAPLPMDEEGRFSRLIVLPSGGAILTLEASDRFGRTVSKRIAVHAT